MNVAVQKPDKNVTLKKTGLDFCSPKKKNLQFHWITYASCF